MLKIRIDTQIQKNIFKNLIINKLMDYFECRPTILYFSMSKDGANSSFHQ